MGNWQLGLLPITHDPLPNVTHYLISPLAGTSYL
ncbi:hypothetical protein LYNGBM3L_02520 [Moorena producens 3L]|uniref:Uncharacterized protein n=1 Tax=Moorena producens 3L TaxID=489825 RepID=F4XIK1_9CYAN|nr:hypothetical protein LYNGBM3L_02520 [Moorena producens 3L]